MPQRSWSAKRERQYEHIKDGLLDRGEPRTRPRRSRRGPSTRSAPAAVRRRQRAHLDRRHLVGRRGGLRSTRAGGPHPRQLYAEAKTGHQGPLEDEQGRARKRRQRVVASLSRLARCSWPVAVSRSSAIERGVGLRGQMRAGSQVDSATGQARVDPG